MTRKEIAEHNKLNRKWANGKATKREILRCMELDQRKRAFDNLAVNLGGAA